ncbi:SIMPL domain-containing protein [Paenibacillus turicensis]|uniref:SIMPL domain-containing protein n=1 Tax=Paenibacillus turicensis TaxID=160487 RepID=UPI003D286372
MKTWLKPVGATLVAGVLLFGTASTGVFANRALAADAVQQNKSIISVVGNGEISVKPDIAYLSIGVKTEAATAKAAQAGTAAKITKLTAVLKDQWKISGKDLKTGDFYVQPNYTYSEKDGQKIKGYSSSHMLQITYRDLDKVGQLLDAVSEAGANQINNVNFGIENPEQFEAEVIEKAMKNANNRAKAIAKSSGRQLGTELSISQSGSDSSLYVQNYQMLEKAQAMGSTADRTTVEIGEINVKMSLNVVYELK